MNIFLKADDKSFTLWQTLNETSSILLKKHTCILICQIEPGVHEILPTVIVFDRKKILLIEFFCKPSSNNWATTRYLKWFIRIFHKTNQKTILNRNKRHYIACWVEFRQCKSMKKEEQTFYSFIYRWQKFKVQVLDNTVTSRKHVHSYRI